MECLVGTTGSEPLQPAGEPSRRPCGAGPRLGVASPRVGRPEATVRWVVQAQRVRDAAGCDPSPLGAGVPSCSSIEHGPRNKRSPLPYAGASSSASSTCPKRWNGMASTAPRCTGAPLPTAARSVPCDSSCCPAGSAAWDALQSIGARRVRLGLRRGVEPLTMLVPNRRVARRRDRPPGAVDPDAVWCCRSGCQPALVLRRGCTDDAGAPDRPARFRPIGKGGKR